MIEILFKTEQKKRKLDKSVKPGYFETIIQNFLFPLLVWT
jgi:hypothetical protein